MGRPIVTIAATAQLKVFAKLVNLRKAPGPEGEMQFKVVNGAFKVYMNENGTEWSKFPTSESLQEGH